MIDLKKQEESGMILAWCIILAVGLIFICWVGQAHAEEYSAMQICDSIYRAEGGAKAKYLYGIRSVHYRDVSHAQQICLRTVRHARRDWLKAGRKGDFLLFLSKRYCPIGCDNDRGSNRFWLKNVRYFLEHP
jgi:hypothetical protein